MRLRVCGSFFAFYPGQIVHTLRAALLTAALLALEIASPAKALADNKIALVIGNSQYRKVPALTNPVNDAADVASSLQRLGFTVQHFSDLDYDGFRHALIAFGKAAKTADKAVIFYAGHGVEIDGKNWLIPVDAEIKSEIDVYAEGINLETLIDLSILPKVVGLIVLDACRNNPFAGVASAGRSLSNAGKPAANTDSNVAQTPAPASTALPGTPAGGLAPVDVSDNVLVAFSAAAGTTANDGNGRNSPYSGALLRYVEKPGLEINYLFRDVHDDVLKETLNTQEPAVYGTLSKDEIFLKEGEARLAAADAESAAEKLAWSFVRATNDIAVLRRFSAQFPGSPHKAEILARTAQLESAEKFAWEMVGRQHTASAYQAFLDLYPFGDHADGARVTLASLATSSPSDAAGAQAIDLPKPPAATYDLASNSTEIIDKPDESSEAIEKAWDVLKEAHDQDVVGRFSEKFPSLRHHRVAPGSDLSLRAVNSTEWLLKTAGDAEVNACFAGESAACVKAIEKYPDYVQLRFQLCRSTRPRGDAPAADRKNTPGDGCMLDAVEDARARGYLVSAFTRSSVEKQRNQEYRTAVAHVQQNVSTIVSNTVSTVVGNVVNNAVGNVVSNATSAAIGRATSGAGFVAAPMIMAPPTARWDSRLGSIRGAVAVAPASIKGGGAVISTPAINTMPKGAGGGPAAASISGAAGNAAGRAASGAAGRAASHAVGNAAGNAAGKGAAAAASISAGRAASNAASRAASNAAANAASRAAAHAASKAASNAAGVAAARISSDIRLKQDIAALGRTRDGLQLYRYRYIGDDTFYVGVMAQEVAQSRPDAVVRGADGFLQVDYGKLGVPFLTLEEWTRRHAAEAKAEAGTED
jgi:uncharacterized caspase-like protein